MINYVNEEASRLVLRIMHHSSNINRSSIIQGSLRLALSRKKVEELRKIIKDINGGKFLPDDFS